MIEVHDLSKFYGPHRAIDRLNFSIQKGEVVGFLGPNGAGKSTTMKIITGFMAPSEGTASVGGYDVFENPIEVKKKIGYLPETPPVYGDMYVKDYLTYVARLKGVEKEKVAKSVERAIEKTNLGEVQKRLIQNLSKGFRQRVGIAQAIVSDPDVLILDEPTVGLDPKQVAEIRELIQELRGHHTIVLSTHVLPEVQATCERLIIINKGQIVAEDTLEGLSSQMQGGSSIQLKLKRPTEEVVARLEGLEGVQSVRAGESSGIYLINTSGNDQVLEDVASQAVNSGWGLLELQSSKANLEDIFLQLTYGKEQGGLQ